MTYEIPNIEPLVERIACLIDQPTLERLAEAMEGGKADSPMFHARYSLLELITNLNMKDALEGLAADPELAPQSVISRCEVFSDTLDVCSDMLHSMDDDDGMGPLVHQPLKTKRALDDALVANLALYGLFALVAGNAEGWIESESEFGEGA